MLITVKNSQNFRISRTGFVTLVAIWLRVDNIANFEACKLDTVRLNR